MVWLLQLCFQRIYNELGGGIQDMMLISKKKKNFPSIFLRLTQKKDLKDTYQNDTSSYH